MTFQEILARLDILSSVTSTLEKQVLLGYYMEDKDFRNVLRFALDPKLSFKMSKLPTPRENLFSSASPLNEREAFSVLKTFSVQKGVSDIEKLELAEGVRKCTGATELINRIVKKDLRCGVKAALVNKVEEGFISLWPYMRCKSHTKKNFENITYPAIAQLKADGLCITLKSDGITGKFFSRVGNEFDFLGMFNDDFTHLFDRGELNGAFIGEGIVLAEDGSILDRKTGNGIINKGLHGTLTKEEASRIRIQLWEFVPLDRFLTSKGDTIPYNESLKIVEKQTRFLKKITPIEYQMVYDYEEVLAYYKDVKERNLEGLIVKNLNGVFKTTSSGSPNQVKVKAVLGEEYEAEFRIIGINPGKEGTRFEHGVGSLQYISECGRIRGNVGSGFSHKERDAWGPEILEKIITIRFDDLIQDKRDTSTWSLYAPRKVDVFRDKLEADTLEYVRELIGG